MSDETQATAQAVTSAATQAVTGAVTHEAVWNEAAQSYDKVPVAAEPAAGTVVLKKAVRPRDRGPHTYDALFELEGIESIVFACDTLPPDESEAYQAAELEFREVRQAKSAKLDDPKLDESTARDLVTELRLLADAHNGRIDAILRTYLKGEGTPGGKVTLIPEAERTDFTPGVKADLVALIMARSTLSENDALFLSRRSR